MLYLCLDKNHHVDYTKIAGGELITRNRALKPLCYNEKIRTKKCAIPSFLNEICQKSSFRLSKTVRLGLDIASDLLRSVNSKGKKILERLGCALF